MPQSIENNWLEEFFCAARDSCYPQCYMVLQICNALVLFIAFLYIQLYKLNLEIIPVNSASVIFPEHYLQKTWQIFFYFLRF